MPRVGSDEITITDISDGDPAPRLASRRLFKTLTSVPQTPQATITWATNALSNIETGWSETSPTQQAASATVVYFSDLLFSDTTGIATSTTATGTSPLPITTFAGVVSFASGDFSADGSTITDIDGGNIATGTVTAGSLTAGTLTSTGVPTGNEEGARFDSDGTMVIGDAEKFIRWDSSTLTVKGEVINLTEEHLQARIGGPFKQLLQGNDLYAPGLNYSSNYPASNSSRRSMDGAGDYIFVMVSGGGGAGGTAEGTTRISDNNGNVVANSASGGGGGGVAVFSIYWDGTTNMSTQWGTIGLGNSDGASNNGEAYPNNNSGLHTPGGDANQTVFKYGTATIVTISGGYGARPSQNGVPGETPGSGGAQFSNNFGNNFGPGFIAAYDYSGGYGSPDANNTPGTSSYTGSYAACGGGGSDFFGVVSAYGVFASQPAGNTVSSGGCPYLIDSRPTVVGASPSDLVTSNDTRTIMGISPGVGVGLFASGFLPGSKVMVYNSANTNTDARGGRGAIMGGGGGARIEYSSTGGGGAFGGNSVCGGGGGGAVVVSANVSSRFGGDGGGAGIFWSKL